MTRTILAAAADDRAAAGSAMAQFYKGKTITMIVNYPAGGPTDIEGRIVAQHLPAHIPGNPTVVVRNVGGAGGLIGSNQLGEAASNGETIGFFTLDDERPDSRQQRDAHQATPSSSLIAGVECPLVVYMRKDTPPGLKTAADIMRTQEFKALSLNVQNTNTLNQLIALDLLGRQVSGGAGLSRPEGRRDRDPAEHRPARQFVAVGLGRLGRADHGTRRHPALAACAARQERQLSAQPRAAEPADLRGVLRLGETGQAAGRAVALRGAARLRRSAACDVPRRHDAAEGLRGGDRYPARGVCRKCGRTRSSSRITPASSRPSRSSSRATKARTSSPTSATCGPRSRTTW